MCFFDQHRFACGDWKWGYFRQHCNREYRTGETCGMKLIMQTVPVTQKCKLCDKIDTKQRRRSAELDRINRWKREGNKFRASIDRSTDMIKVLDREIFDLGSERQRRLQAIWNGSYLLGNFGEGDHGLFLMKRVGGGFGAITFFYIRVLILGGSDWKRREAGLGLVLQIKRVLLERYLSLKLMLSGGNAATPFVNARGQW